MKIFKIDSEAGNHITNFNSNFLFSPIFSAIDEGYLHIGHVEIPQNGVIGYHQAPYNQLMLILKGEALVRGKSSETERIVAGQAVFWEAGEFHETTSAEGVTAIVIESTTLSPHKFLSEVK